MQIRYRKERNIYINILTCILIILLQFINPIITVITYIILIKYALKSRINSVKSLIISFIIAYLNPGLFTLTSLIQILRWILFFICISTIVIKGKYKKVYLYESKKWMIYLFIWILYMAITSYINSQLVHISILKLISYSLGFYAISIGVSCNDDYDWSKWILSYFVAINFLSLLYLNSPIGKLKNGRAFQGIWNHPNGFAVILTMLIVMAIVMLKDDKYKKHKYLIIMNIFISIIFVYKTECRTAIFTIIFVGMLVIMFNFKRIIINKIAINKIMVGILISIFFIGGICIYRDSINEAIHKVIYKRGETSLLSSSQSIIDSLVNDISEKPLFGNGFGVGGKVHAESSDNVLSYPTEKRNIVLAVLSEGGIIGILLFSIFLVSYGDLFNKLINFRCLNLDIILYLTPILLNMAEMSFFSANGFGILIWFMFAIYRQKINVLKGDRLSY